MHKKINDRDKVGVPAQVLHPIILQENPAFPCLKKTHGGASYISGIFYGHSVTEIVYPF